MTRLLQGGHVIDYMFYQQQQNFAASIWVLSPGGQLFLELLNVRYGHSVSRHHFNSASIHLIDTRV